MVTRLHNGLPRSWLPSLIASTPPRFCPLQPYTPVVIQTTPCQHAASGLLHLLLQSPIVIPTQGEVGGSLPRFPRERSLSIWGRAQTCRQDPE